MQRSGVQFLHAIKNITLITNRHNKWNTYTCGNGKKNNKSYVTAYTPHCCTHTWVTYVCAYKRNRRWYNFCLSGIHEFIQKKNDNNNVVYNTYLGFLFVCWFGFWMMTKTKMINQNACSENMHIVINTYNIYMQKWWNIYSSNKRNERHNGNTYILLYKNMYKKYYWFMYSFMI